MRILSLFDGISCGRLALKKTGVNVSKYYASEIDKYAISITQHNFPDTIQVGDITELKGEDFKDIDIIMGGSPCQDLSIAKQNREGLKGSRSNLFYDFVRLIKEIKPKYFILENVNSMSKESKRIITEELFNIEPVMINSALVSAQNRRRLFWVGKLVGDTYEKVEVSQPEDKGIVLKDILEDEVDDRYFLNDSALKTLNRTSYGAKGSVAEQDGKTKTLTASAGGGGGNGIHVEIKNLCEHDGKAKSMTASMHKGYGNDGMSVVRVGQIGKGGQGQRIYSEEGKSVSLSAQGGGQGAKTGLYVTGCASRTYPRTKQEGVKREKRTELRKDKKANSITSVSGDSMVCEDLRVRRLTPVECERLQTVPDYYTAKGLTEKGVVDISNTQRYKSLGNGWTVDVVAHIIKHLK